MLDPMLGGYLEGQKFSLGPQTNVNTGNYLKRNASESFNIGKDIQKRVGINKFQNSTLDAIDLTTNPISATIGNSTKVNNSQYLQSANQSLSKAQESRPKIFSQYPFSKQLTTEEYSNEISQNQIKKSFKHKKYSSKLNKEVLTIN